MERSVFQRAWVAEELANRWWLLHTPGPKIKPSQPAEKVRAEGLASGTKLGK